MPDRRRSARLSRLRRGWRRVTTPSGFWKWLGRRYHLGHRAAFLIAFGLIYFAIGLAILLGAGAYNPLLYHTWLPEALRVALWCTTGALAVGLSRHPRYQWAGFAALALAPVERLTSYVAGCILLFIPGGSPGNLGAFITQVVLYGGVLFLTRLCASWPDPPGDALP